VSTEPVTGYLCGTHNRFVEPGTKPGDLKHVNGSLQGPCSSVRFTEITKRKLTREETLAMLAWEGTGGHDV
jgi:hypothetical protein